MPHAHTTLTASAATWQRYPRLACARSLPAQARTFHVVEAAQGIDHVAHYTVVDCHSNGAAYYATPRYSLVPQFEAWQLACLAAISRLREWQRYSDSPQ